MSRKIEFHMHTSVYNRKHEVHVLVPPANYWKVTKMLEEHFPTYCYVHGTEENPGDRVVDSKFVKVQDDPKD